MKRMFFAMILIVAFLMVMAMPAESEITMGMLFKWILWESFWFPILIVAFAMV